METAVEVVDFAATVASCAALAIWWTGRKYAFRRDLTLLFAGVLVLVLFRNVSNSLESSKLSSGLDVVEDYAEILLPIVWGFFLYVFLRGITEEALRRSEAHVRSLVETAPSVILNLDSAGTILEFNPEAERVYGRAREEVLGQNFLELLVPQRHREAIAADLQKVLSGRPTRGFESPVSAADAAELIVSWNVDRLLDDQGRPTGIVAIGQDVTLRKQAEREREQLIEQLETQNAELERFTYTVSHDLKSPLITIKGYLGLLQEDVTEGRAEAVSDDIQRMTNAAQTMERLLGDLLELSRIGRLANVPEDVALADLAQEAVALVGGRSQARGVEIHVSPDLPVAFGDRSRLLEVFQNLVDNAVKYMGDQDRPQIEIGTRLAGEERICYVRDNGVGVDPRYHERIFQLFDQLDPSAEGTGIGLALVKRIVEVHGGRIWVESEGRGKGSAFCFTLPLRGESSIPVKEQNGR